MKAQASEIQSELLPAHDRIMARLAAGIVLVGLISIIAGCRGRAHEDLYRAKMANEIRVLEDQLYDADYQNRVLRDELNRARLDAEEAAASGPRQQSRPKASPPTQPRSQQDDEILDIESLETDDPFMDDQNTSDAEPEGPSGEKTKPAVETPEATTPEAGMKSTSPEPLVDTQTGGLGMPPEAVPTPVPDDSNSPSTELPLPAELPTPPAELPAPAGELPAPNQELPAPSELIPPGEGELMDEQIIPGPPLPPAEDPSVPPGKTAEPQGAKTLHFQSPAEAPLPVPDHLELHDGLSGGHQFDKDSEIDGLYLVVTVADQSGTVLSLDDFDVDAELTVVVVDPNDESEDNRVGRWDFNPEEVRQMVRKAPVDGIHIPISWQDRAPQSGDVMVHIRLAAAEEEMQCQGRVRLEESVAVSNWLPRG